VGYPAAHRETGRGLSAAASGIVEAIKNDQSSSHRSLQQLVLFNAFFIIAMASMVMSTFNFWFLLCVLLLVSLDGMMSSSLRRQLWDRRSHQEQAGKNHCY
jgi:hypothetical protein